MGKIVRGFWSCKYCGNTDIDGLKDTCPGCGKQKSKDVKYYMKEGIVEEVTAEELSAAGIIPEEDKESAAFFCDGHHKDWVCNYCEQLNNWADTTCVACGSPKDQATHEYGMDELVKAESDAKTSWSRTEMYQQFSKQFAGSNSETVSCRNEKDETKEILTENTTENNKWKSVDAQVEGYEDDIVLPPSKWQQWLFAHIPQIAVALLIITACAFLFWPIKETRYVTGFSWNRTVTVEEERTVKENGWSVPSGGRVYDKKTEIRSYRDVIDHYETVTEQKSRRVLSHYETVTEQKSRRVISHYDTSYRDNGNGTFTEQRTPVYTTEYYTDSHQEPVYKTEYYTETRQEPVYRKEPVYDTRYYYEIEKWFDVEDYPSAGQDKAPYWNASYVLSDKERDSKREENYFVYYDDHSNTQVSYGEWTQMELGDGYEIIKNRLGMTYKRKEIGGN